MFTGIVEELGALRDVAPTAAGARLWIACERVRGDLGVGDSVSVNGCCVTVDDLDGQAFGVDLMEPTLERTALGDLRPGDPVNLERAMRAGDRFGGHLVQGHVDAVTTVVEANPHRAGDPGAPASAAEGPVGAAAAAAGAAEGPEPGWVRMVFALPDELGRYVVDRGSVTVDGVSLTVAGLDAATFSVGIVPHTQAATTLGSRRPGDRVNLEVDLIAKYVERLLTGDTPSPYRTVPPTRGEQT